MSVRSRRWEAFVPGWAAAPPGLLCLPALSLSRKGWRSRLAYPPGLGTVISSRLERGLRS